jgi:hypothetical protein
MVERSKRPARRPRVTMHQLAVMLETMRGESRVVGEAVQGVDSRLQGFQKEVDTRLGRVEHDIVLLKDVVVENTRELKHLRVAVDKKVDRDEVEAIVEGVLRRRA